MIVAEHVADAPDWRDQARRVSSDLFERSPAVYWTDFLRDYIKSRADEHNEYVDEDNKQLGVDMSKFILFRG